MPSPWRWMFVVMAATAIDLLVRFGTSFDFTRVMHVEAGLFPVTGAVLVALHRHAPSTQGWGHVVRVGLVWLFGLGGLRSILWTCGLPLMTANLATLVVLLAGVLLSMYRRRRHRMAELSRGAT